MSEQQNVQTIRDIYAAFSRGDIPSILSHLSDDVKWHTHLEQTVPWAGDYSGISRVPAFFQAISDSVDVLGFDPEEFVANGDTVVSLGWFACRPKSTGKSVRTKWIFVWKFDGGRVTSYEQFHEPALADAFKKTAVAV